MNKKDRILLDILKQSSTKRILVVAVRDMFIEQLGDEAADPAATRRWVNGKFKTLINKGVLVRKSNPDSKKHHFEKTAFFDQYLASQVEPTRETTNNDLPLPSVEGAVLDRELESYRQTMLSQLGEIEEYRRIREQYPELGPAATTQFKQVVDENYRMLGRIRAIEKLMASMPS